MSLITNLALQGILDKHARWAMESVGDPSFGGSFNAGMAQANADCYSGAGSVANAILATADESVIADLMPSARDLDEIPPVPPTRFLFGVAEVAKAIAAIDAHLKRYSAFSTLDAYLISLNGPTTAQTPTLRVHQAFYDHLKTLSRQNVFIGTDTVLGHIVATGAAAGTYTHDAALPTYVAGSKLVAKNVGALGSNTSISVTGKKMDGTTATLTATISTLTDAHETDLSATTKLFVDVTAISITGGATSTNRINIVAKTDRSIAAA